MTAILEARGLCYHYAGGVPGLSGLDLAVTAHQRLALLGANGAGKTTVLLHLNGTLRPDRGELWLRGARGDYSRAGLLAWRQQVGIVFQNPEDQLFAGTVYQDVSFGPLNLGLPASDVRARVDAALAALEITDLHDRPTHMLSFGQKKRVAIAGAIAMHPSVLILDEPTAGLDPDGTAQLLHALHVLHQAGTTIVLATHDMDLAYEWADTVAVLGGGRTLGQGAPDAVLGDRELLAACRLRMPFLLELARGLAAAGVPVAPMPRTREALLATLATCQPALLAGTPTSGG